MIQSIILLTLIILVSLIPLSHGRIFHNLLNVKYLIGGGNFFDYQHTTSLRGIAILIIVVGHISGTFKTVILNPLPSTGVTIFLILSGYGLYSSFIKNGLKGFWLKKYIRVMLPYIIVITILMAVGNEFDIIRYLYEITGLKTTYWYVDYQIKWYIVFFSALLFIPRYSLITFFFASVLMFFLMSSLAAEQSFAFLIGVMIAKNRDRLRSFSFKKWIYLMIIFALIASVALIIKQLPQIREYLGTKFYSSIQLIINLNYGLTIICASAVLPIVRNSFLLLLSGLISYEIYLIHFPFYGLVKGNLGLALLLIVCSIFASYLFFKFNIRLSNLIIGLKNKYTLQRGE